MEEECLITREGGARVSLFTSSHSYGHSLGNGSSKAQHPVFGALWGWEALGIRSSLPPCCQLAASPGVHPPPPFSLPAFQLVKLGIIAYKPYKPFTKSKLNNCKVL